MEILIELWNFSISPYGIWLWALLAFIPAMIWADWRDAKVRKNRLHADHDLEYNRRTNPSGNDLHDDIRGTHETQFTKSTNRKLYHANGQLVQIGDRVNFTRSTAMTFTTRNESATICNIRDNGKPSLKVSVIEADGNVGEYYHQVFGLVCNGE